MESLSQCAFDYYILDYECSFFKLSLPNYAYVIINSYFFYFWSTSTDLYFYVHHNKSFLKLLEIEPREHVLTLSIIIRVQYILHIVIVGVSLFTTHAILVRLKMLASSEKYGVVDHQNTCVQCE